MFICVWGGACVASVCMCLGGACMCVRVACVLLSSMFMDVAMQ